MERLRWRGQLPITECRHWGRSEKATPWGFFSEWGSRKRQIRSPGPVLDTLLLLELAWGKQNGAFLLLQLCNLSDPGTESWGPPLEFYIPAVAIFTLKDGVILAACACAVRSPMLAGCVLVHAQTFGQSMMPYTWLALSARQHLIPTDASGKC